MKQLFRISCFALLFVTAMSASAYGQSGRFEGGSDATDTAIFEEQITPLEEWVVGVWRPADTLLYYLVDENGSYYIFFSDYCEGSYVEYGTWHIENGSIVFVSTRVNDVMLCRWVERQETTHFRIDVKAETIGEIYLRRPYVSDADFLTTYCDYFGSGYEAWSKEAIRRLASECSGW